MSAVLVLSSRPLTARSVLGSALERLGERGLDAATSVVTADAAVPDGAAAADLLVLRDVPAATLAALATAAPGVPTCNSVAATSAVSDKALVDERLRSAGLPVPRSTVVVAWAEVSAAAAGSAVVVKPTSGRDGGGVLLCPTPTALPPAAPYPGPWLVQELVPGDGTDRKVYVIDEEVSGVLRRWPPRTATDKLGASFRPSDEERSLALAVGAALGLEVFGVDLVGEATGPKVVVDVNAMPGFKGVDGAASRLAEHFLGHVSQEAASCAS